MTSARSKDEFPEEPGPMAVPTSRSKGASDEAGDRTVDLNQQKMVEIAEQLLVTAFRRWPRR